MRRFRITIQFLLLYIGFQLVAFDSKAQVGNDIGNYFSDLFDVKIFRETFSIDIVNNRFVGETNGVKQFWKLSGVNLSLMHQFELDWFYFATGIRYSQNRFKNTGWFNTTFGEEGRTSVFENLPDTIVRQNSRFVANYIELPIEIRIRDYDEYWIGVTRYTLGCVIGYNVSSFEHWTQGNLRFKEYNFAPLNKYRVGIYARYGRKFWGIYAGYYFTPLFNSPNSSKLRIFNFGLNIAI
jgi:hypothetical protein